jgi:hypothetical protein
VEDQSRQKVVWSKVRSEVAKYEVVGLKLG